MIALTSRQRQTLDTIRSYIAENGIPPTLREIGARIKVRSTNGVNDHLRALERKGYIRRRDMAARGIVLVDEAPVNATNELVAMFRALQPIDQGVFLERIGAERKAQ